MGDFLVYTIGFPITFLLLVMGMSLAARRILGLRIGLIRTALMCALAMSIATSIFGETSTEPSAALVTVQLGLAILVVIGLLAFAEIIVPTGSIPPPTEWWGMARRRLARTRRYSRITAIAFRHGLGPYLRGRERTSTGLARSLRLALQDAGVTFVKLGQVLSTRADLLPQDFVDELSLLQDKVPAAKWDQVRAVLDAEVGLDAFQEVDPEPLAAASIAQVHRAVLKSGAEVVVKVQRPDVRATAEGDLDIVTRLAEKLQRTRWGSALGVRDLAAGFAAALREELDFKIEARNITTVAAASDSSVGLPHVHLSTPRVLVMDRLVGVPLRGASEDAGLARTLLRFVLRQVMLDGVFHADPHPGNVLLLADGRLGLLDFGSVGRIDSALRSALQRLLLAIDRSDPAGLTDALLELTSRPEDIDEQRLERALGQFMARHLGAGMRPDVEMFGDLFLIVSRFGLSIPPEIAAVFRALATLEGTLAVLAPGFNIVVESRSFAAEQISERLTPESVQRTMAEELQAVLPMLRRLPRRIDRITGAVEQGRLSMSMRLFADERDRSFITGLLHQVMLTALGATAGVMAVLLLGSTGPQLAADVGLHQVLGYNLLIIAVLLGLRVVVTVLRPRA
ncbi:ABC1 kinase family protein [Lentzea flaviverrucosa]|uniref:Ubiquinone biosynthesis protein n=1 Tax=Lentzea flaviverrucosa TaxID=200379 RepID=A0A1H9U8N1_9PSEU|nr:AarF/UbiB family protein [Lentzea flaviverrucosa]RDI33255.1 ubiquinone biosynthesis protein [Lentzea flaviverrucosa]SES05598.1 ubiquinone biosynthesis protein [Lentzea flaviverrucosa]